jgi:membrane protease YdiL (CAAX protease family)
MSDVQTYNLLNEVSIILFYEIPAIAYIFLLIYRDTSAIKMSLRFTRRDLIAALITFILIYAQSTIVGEAAYLFNKFFFTIPDISSVLPLPNTISGWIALFAACLCTGYLEESFFRVYLEEALARFNKNKITTFNYSVYPKQKPRFAPGVSVILPLIMFSVCHYWEGAFGIINAFCAGVIFHLIYKRTRSLHGIALSHAFYDFAVYLFLAF